MGRLDGRRALVTGGSRGIGRAIALAFAAEGADVAVVYRREAEQAAEVEAAVEAAGRRGSAHQADVREWDEVERAVGEAAAALGGLDTVVVNAGVASRPDPVVAVDPGYWRRVIGINLDGAFHTVKAAIPHVQAGGRGGAVVFVSSVGADLCPPNGAAYYASKAAMNALMRSLAKEVRADGIRVNAIGAGLIRTEMGEGVMGAGAAGFPGSTVGEPEDIAAVAVFLASDQARFVTGQVWRADGGVTA